MWKIIQGVKITICKNTFIFALYFLVKISCCKFIHCIACSFESFIILFPQDWWQPCDGEELKGTKGICSLWRFGKNRGIKSCHCIIISAKQRPLCPDSTLFKKIVISQPEEKNEDVNEYSGYVSKIYTQTGLILKATSHRRVLHERQISLPQPSCKLKWRAAEKTIRRPKLIGQTLVWLQSLYATYALLESPNERKKFTRFFVEKKETRTCLACLVLPTASHTAKPSTAYFRHSTM